MLTVCIKKNEYEIYHKRKGQNEKIDKCKKKNYWNTIDII